VPDSSCLSFFLVLVLGPHIRLLGIVLPPRISVILPWPEPLFPPHRSRHPHLPRFARSFLEKMPSVCLFDPSSASGLVRSHFLHIADVPVEVGSSSGVGPLFYLVYTPLFHAPTKSSLPMVCPEKIPSFQRPLRPLPDSLIIVHFTSDPDYFLSGSLIFLQPLPVLGPFRL